MKTEFVAEYGEAWRVFERLVKNFDADGWVNTGRKMQTPVRIAVHTLRSCKYFSGDPSPDNFASGRTLAGEWDPAPAAGLPTQADILGCIHEVEAKTEAWLSEMDYTSKNTAFAWAGETKLSLVIVVLRHFLYHLGEISSLLNESKGGEVGDNYVGPG
jgi:hypothetical protein